MKKYTLLLLNGGIGSRVSAGMPKQLVKINGIPMIVYSLVAVSNIKEINEIVINYPEGYKEEMEKIVADYAVDVAVKFVPAGVTRQESVSLMMNECSNGDVIIHESARPLVNEQDFRNIIESEFNNVSFMINIPFTVAEVDSSEKKVSGKLERESLRNVQLPQKYVLHDLIASHEWAEENELVYTEDATLCFDHGIDVNYIEGKDENIKITKNIDVKIAEFLLKGKDINE